MYMFVVHYFSLVLFQTTKTLGREDALERARVVREQKRNGAYERL